MKDDEKLIIEYLENKKMNLIISEDAASNFSEEFLDNELVSIDKDDILKFCYTNVAAVSISNKPIIIPFNYGGFNNESKRQ